MRLPQSSPLRTLHRLAWITLLCLCPHPFATAQEACTFGSGAAADALTQSLTLAPSCQAAVKKLHDCAWGSSADAQFSPIVVSKCEKSFFPALSPIEKSRYTEDMQLCAYRYAREQGTMAISAAALCQADVAADYAAHPDLAHHPAQRASFDCNAAHTPLKTAICSDPQLGHADLLLSRIYADLLLNPTVRAEGFLLPNQKQWLQNLPATCSLSAAPPSPNTLSCLRNQFELCFTALDSCSDVPDENLKSCLESPDEDSPAPEADTTAHDRASFSCEKPSTALEIVICADADLGQLDIQLAHTYHAARTAIAPAHAHELILSQRRWLHSVNATCPLGVAGGIPPVLTRACVRTAFETRIAQLQACPLKPSQDQATCLTSFSLFPTKQ